MNKIYDEVYEKIIRSVVIVFCLATAFFVYVMVYSLLQKEVAASIVSLIVIILFGWLIRGLKNALKSKNVKEIPFLLRILIHFLRRVY